jgi:uncharacterized protein (TIGR02444 family)
VRESAGAFWDWSSEVYARPGIAETCLALQDRHGADVNLLLWSLWLARLGRELDAQAAARAIAMSWAWQGGTTGRLRQIRRDAKLAAAAESDPAREQLLRKLHRACAEAELAAERVEQHGLDRLSSGCAPSQLPPGELASMNLARVLPPGMADDAGPRAIMAAALNSVGE